MISTLQKLEDRYDVDDLVNILELTVEDIYNAFAEECEGLINGEEEEGGSGDQH